MENTGKNTCFVAMAIAEELFFVIVMIATCLIKVHSFQIVCFQ
jgi:hypothetical protein